MESGVWPGRRLGSPKPPMEGGGVGGLHRSSQFQRLRFMGKADQWSGRDFDSGNLQELLESFRLSDRKFPTTGGNDRRKQGLQKHNLWVHGELSVH